MARSRKKTSSSEEPPEMTLARLSALTQVDFELEFFGAILARQPNYVEVMRAHASNLAVKGRHNEGLEIDRRLIEMMPSDPLTWYNLACNYALLKKPDLALETLRKAIEMGYRDFAYMKNDQDLVSLRRNPEFRKLLSEYESKR